MVHSNPYLDFELGGELVEPDVTYGVMRLIAEGSGGDDDEGDDAVRVEAVDTFPATWASGSFQTISRGPRCWVLGECSYVKGSDTLADVCDKLCEIAEKQISNNATTLSTY